MSKPEPTLSELPDLLERFRRGPELMAMALTGAAGSEYDYVPAPGKWSVRQIVAHVADAEIVGAERFRRVLAEDNPTLQPFDQNAWASNLDYAQRKPSQSLETFRRIRSDSHELLKSVPESVFSRTGSFAGHGPITLLEMLRDFAEHAERHALQLRSVRDAFKQSKTR